MPCLTNLAIAKMCFEHQELLDTEYWLKKAGSSASKYDLIACERLAIKVSIAQGEVNRARGIANQIFNQQPSFAEYQNLLSLKQSQRIEDDTFLARVELQLKAQPLRSNCNDDLLEFYISSKALNKAHQFALKHSAEPSLLLQLADSFITDMPTHSIDYYFRVAMATIEQANNTACQQAIELLKNRHSNYKITTLNYLVIIMYGSQNLRKILNESVICMHFFNSTLASIYRVVVVQRTPWYFYNTYSDF